MTTRTQRQQARTRRSLLDAGRHLIAAKGVSGLRVQEITEQADIALGSFYNYFASKEEFIEAIITEMLTDLSAAIVAEGDGDTDPAEIVAVASLRIVGLAHKEPGLARLIVNIAHSESLFGKTIHPYASVAIERGMETGRFYVVDLDVLLTSVIGGAFALIREILDGGHGPHAEVSFARHVLTSLGLTPAEALAIVERIVRELAV